MDQFTNGYDFLFSSDFADSRVYNWPLMSSPWPILGILALYLYMIYYFLPSFMANKKPYSLKTILVLYNIFQVVACIVLIYGVATSGWTTHYKLICEPLDKSNDKLAIRMASWVWWTMILKLVELFETPLFVLRKKFFQVSILHVYHHVTTAIVTWITCKYHPGGLLTLPIILNSFVHVIMYTYYLLSTFGPKMQKKLLPLKNKLTILQMVQLCLIILCNLQTLLPSCKITALAAIIQVPNMIIIIYFFGQFYRTSYLKKSN